MAKLSKFELFKGTINSVKKEVLTHTSGETNIETDIFTGKVSGGGNVETYHEHYTDFKIENQRFRCWGDYIFEDGDKVVLYASATNQGFYKVETCKNFTRNFVVNVKVAYGIWGKIKAIFGGILALIFIPTAFSSYATIKETIESPVTQKIVFGVVVVVYLCFVFFLILFNKDNKSKKLSQLNKEIANYPEF